MDLPRREYLLARVEAGVTRLCATDPRTRKRNTFLLRQPSRLQRLLAQEVYQEALRDGELEGLLTDEQIVTRLVEEELWSAEEEEKLKKLAEDMEEFKVQLYAAGFKKGEASTVRSALNFARKEMATLLGRKNGHSYASVTGNASLARARYLVGAGLCWPNGTSVFTSEDSFWDSTNPLLDEAMTVFFGNRLEEADYRELARSDPWRPKWVCRKAEASVFGTPVVDLTDEQRSLLCWSITYDSVFEHPECPAEAVWTDDDMLDGWMTVQRRKRQQEQDARRTEDAIGSDKIRQCNEVFVMARNVDEAREIDALNDEASRLIKRRRLNFVARSGGEVDETDMPDSKMRIREQAMQKFSSQMRG